MAAIRTRPPRRRPDSGILGRSLTAMRRPGVSSCLRSVIAPHFSKGGTSGNPGAVQGRPFARFPNGDDEHVSLIRGVYFMISVQQGGHCLDTRAAEREATACGPRVCGVRTGVNSPPSSHSRDPPGRRLPSCRLDRRAGHPGCAYRRASARNRAGGLRCAHLRCGC